MPPSDEPEAELQAFIDRHYGRLVGLLRFRGADPAEAEDLAQESMVRLVAGWERVGQLDEPWAWLVTVAMNLSRSRWRRLQTVLRRGHLVGGDPVHHDAAAIEALALLAGLTERQRTAVVLRHYAGLSVRETAEAMGVAEGTVKSLCSAGLKAAQRQAGADVEAVGYLAPTAPLASTERLERG